MLDFILNNKWSILLISECIAWLFLFAMGYYRYWKPSKAHFIIVTILSCLFGYVPHFSIPVLMCIKEGSWTALYQSKDALLFDGFILALIIFGFTLGKKYVIKIDRYFAQKATHAKEKIKA